MPRRKLQRRNVSKSINRAGGRQTAHATVCIASLLGALARAFTNFRVCVSSPARTSTCCSSPSSPFSQHADVPRRYRYKTGEEWSLTRPQMAIRRNSASHSTHPWKTAGQNTGHAQSIMDYARLGPSDLPIATVEGTPPSCDTGCQHRERNLQSCSLHAGRPLSRDSTSPHTHGSRHVNPETHCLDGRTSNTRTHTHTYPSFDTRGTTGDRMSSPACNWTVAVPRTRPIQAPRHSRVESFKNSCRQRHRCTPLGTDTKYLAHVLVLSAVQSTHSWFWVMFFGVREP